MESLIAIDQIEKKIALASRLRDVNPQKALEIVGTVRALLQASERNGDTGSVSLWKAECALNAAWANVRLGRFVAAYPEAEEGLRLFREQGNLQGTASCLLVHGIAKGEEGRNDEAVKLCLEAEALCPDKPSCRDMPYSDTAQRRDLRPASLFCHHVRYAAKPWPSRRRDTHPDR